MRICKLELRRFGQFTDTEIDFGTDSGVDVVLGANEAGKSTSLDAIRYSLFGMPAGKSLEPKYDFLHPSQKIRTALSLRSGAGDVLWFARSRAKRATIVDGVRDPETDDVDASRAGHLAALLAGVTRDSWSIRHGLNQKLLREGSQALLGDDQGEESLFAIGSGMVSIRRVADEITAARRNLLSDAGNKGAIGDAIKQLSRASKTRNTTRRSLNRYEDLRGQQDQGDRELSELREQRHRRERDVQRLTRARDAVSRLGRRAQLAAQLADIDDLPPAWGADEHERLAKLRETTDRLTSEIATGQSKLAQLSGRRDALRVDDALIAAHDTLTELHGQIAQISELKDTLPALRTAVVSAQTALHAAVEQVQPGADDSLDPASVLPSAAVRAQFAAAIERVVAIDTQISEAKTQLEDAQADRERAASAVPQAGADEQRSATLNAALAAASKIDVERLQQELLEHDAAVRTLEEQAARIPGASLDVAALQRLALPGRAEREQLEQRFATLTANTEAERQKITQAQSKIEERAAQLEKIDQAHNVPDTGELARLREDRQTRWKALKGNILEGTALADPAASVHGYEEQVRDADSYADKLADAGAVVGQAAELRRARTRDEERIALATRRLDELAAQRVQLDIAWRELWAPAQITAASVQTMGDVVAQIEEIRARHNELAGARTKLDAQDATMQSAQRALHDALGGAADAKPAPLAVLCSQAEAECRRLHDALLKAESAQGALRQAKSRERTCAATLQRAENALRMADEEWRAALTAVGLDPSAGAAGAQALQAAFALLERAIDENAEANQAYTEADARVRAFDARVAALVESLGASARNVDAADPVTAISLLRKLAGEANAARTGYDEITRQLNEGERTLEAQRTQLTGAEAGLASLQQLAGVDEHGALDAIDVRWCERDALRTELRELEQQLVETAQMSVHDLVELVAARDSVELDAERERLVQEQERAGEAERKLAAETKQLGEQLGALTSATEHADALIEIADARGQLEQLLPEYRQLVVQERTLSTLLDARARKDREPVIARTNEYLQTITDGRWRRLLTGIDEHGAPQAQLERDDGECVALLALSEGTADQLYLALRLALLVEQAQHGESMPLVLDDILPSFDDPRAAATLRLLGDVSQYMQVIFFTHHEHLAALANRELPASRLRVHRLTPASAGTARAAVAAPSR